MLTSRARNKVKKVTWSISRYQAWTYDLRNSSVLRLRLKDANDEDDVTCDGRLFHAWAAATRNARPPRLEKRSQPLTKVRTGIWAKVMRSSINSDLVPEVLDHIAEWAKENNLNLNSSKSKEMIIRRPKTRPDDLPGQIAGIERFESMNILGVTLRYDLSIPRTCWQTGMQVGADYVCSGITPISGVKWPEFMGGDQSYSGI